MTRFLTEDPGRTEEALSNVGEEREAQFVKWGPQHHPDGTGGSGAAFQRDLARNTCDRAAAEGRVTWALILHEEFMEAMAEADIAMLRKELVQVAAVAVAWVEDIDSRHPYADVHDLGGEA